ncbi:zinc ABC transporter substrate-binding protein ZnuA [Vibrio sp. FNV 38]|nr:zinc ABC transporter substrate-binding protein ZnuA [Vibrio sp. FNV 38]
MNQRIVTLIALLCTFSLPAKAFEILTTIKPIQMITLELTQGVTQPDVLLSSNTSPHDYALRPSDARKIREADAIVWFGPELETFLTRMVESDQRVITISDFEGIEFREYEDSHAHDGHNHGVFDPHFWLGVSKTQRVAQQLAEKFGQIDPDNKAQYQANYKRFSAELEQLKIDIQDKLNPVKHKGYFVFHDAYGYFEEEFGLNHLGYFTVSPDRKPGAKTLINIRTTLAKGETECVFAEPQFTPAVIDSVTRGSDVSVGVLDPVASEIEVKSGSYVEFSHQLADSFTSCLSNSD